MSEAQEVEAMDKKPRRRLSDDQRVAERKAEIARIEAKQKEKVRELMEDALDVLREAAARADSCGMTVEGRQIDNAIKDLDPSSGA